MNTENTHRTIKISASVFQKKYYLTSYPPVFVMGRRKQKLDRSQEKEY